MIRPEYEAEWDARTLRDAELIKADANRLKLAQAAAKKMVEQERKEATAMQKVAGKGGEPNDPQKSTQPDQPKYGPGVTRII